MELTAEKLATLEFLPAELRTQVIQKSPVVIMFVLVAVLAYQLAGITWSVVERYFVSPQPEIVETQPQAQAKTTLATVSNYSHLAKLHLFGKQDESKPIEKTPQTAPETSLSLVLYGVFTESDNKRGAAIIGEKTGDQEFYNVGDKVSTGVWLSEVRKDQVLLKRGASYEALKFPKEPSIGVNIQDSDSGSDPGAGHGMGNVPQLSRTKQSFMDSVRIVPVFSGKERKLKGYRILPKKDRASYNRLGLRPSDIITSINGIALNDQRQAMNVIKELVESEQVEVKLDRNGREENMVLKLK